MDRIFISDIQIKKAVEHLRTLTQDQRVEVRTVLEGLKQSGIGREELHRALYQQLRKSFELTVYDIGLVEKALFG